MRVFITLPFTEYNYHDQVKEDEMGKAYRTNGARTKRNAYRLLVQTQKERDDYEYQDLGR
jgi:hypothetical protein